MRNGRQLLTAGALVLLAVFGWGQVEEKSGLSQKAKAAAPKANEPPVTVAELHATIERVEGALRKIVLASSEAPLAHRDSPVRPAKRSEIASELYRLFQLAKPHFKFTPRPVSFDSKLISIPESDPARKPLETLIQFGCIGKVSPLAAGAAPTLTPQEYGDALGFFVARMGDLTHTPSSKWSPSIFNHKDG